MTKTTADIQTAQTEAIFEPLTPTVWCKSTHVNVFYRYILHKKQQVSEKYYSTWSPHVKMLTFRLKWENTNNSKSFVDVLKTLGFTIYNPN